MSVGIGGGAQPGSGMSRVKRWQQPAEKACCFQAEAGLAVEMAEVPGPQIESELRLGKISLLAAGKVEGSGRDCGQRPHSERIR